MTAGHDADAGDDSVTLAHTAVGGEYEGVSADLAVTVVDDDAVIVFSPVPLRVAEGAAATYTVALGAAPSVDVTVTVSGSSGTDVVLSGLSGENTLTFTSLDWDAAQAVTVTAGQDADAGDDSVTLAHTAVGGEYEGVSADLAVTVVDDDAVIVFSPVPLRVAEGAAATYTVALAAPPSVDVTVTVSGSSGTDVVLSGLSGENTLTFTSLDWDTAQTVTVTAGHDADASDDSVTLTHTAAGGEYDVVTAQLAVTVADDDAVIVFAPVPLRVTEGAAATYTVALGAPPTADVTVTVSGSSGTDVALSGLSAQNTLTFTPLDWDAAQAVTVTAGHDADAGDDSVTLTHTAAGGEYEGVTAQLAVTVADDDAVIVFAPVPLRVAEGAAATYTVALGAPPTADVTVTVSGSSGTDVALSGLSAQNTLTFTPLDWDAAQAVTVTAGHDADAGDDSVTLAHTAVGGEYEGVSADLAVTVVDDDAVIVFSPVPLRVIEGGAASYTVALAAPPSVDVTVTVSGSSGTDVVLSGLSGENTLTFTPLDWDAAQAVTVTAGHDADAGDDSVTLAHTAVGGEYEGVSADLAVTVVDDDAVIVFSPVPLRVAEGAAATYTVALGAPPSVDVTVTVSGQSGTDVTLSGLSGENTLTFTPLDWDTAQAVTVTAGHDADASDDSVTLTHTAAGGEYDGVTAELAVTVADDDAVIVFAPVPLRVAEGAAATYTVALGAPPTADVTVTVSGFSGTDVVLSGLSGENTLTFTSLDWDTAQAVTVTAGQDADASDDSVTLAHTAVGGQYEGVSADLAVTVVDDDAVIVFSPVPLRVIEGGAATYTVALGAAPSVDVTVTVSGFSGTDVVLSGLSAQNTLTFTSLDWDTAQAVTVTAGQDADASDDSVTLTHTAVGGQYGGVSADLAVTVVDDDAVIVFVPTSVTVAEGGAATYTVALGAAPSVDVTVTVSGFSGTDVVLSGLSAQNTLRFTSLDWDTAQAVTVTAGQDADASDDSVTLTHTAVGGQYGGVSADLAVTVVDDDAVIVFVPTSVTVAEGGAAVTRWRWRRRRVWM